MKSLVTAHLVVPFWCSFRMPYTINVNFSFPVPPPTTLYGLICCALGMPADHFGLKPELQLNVGLEANGDLIETFSRIIKRDSRNPDRRTLLIRQKLLQPEFRLFLRADTALARRVAEALANPVYPLALGESDDMVEIDEIEVYEECADQTNVVHGALPADLAVKPKTDCQTVYLPIGFKAAKGKRSWSGVQYRTFYLARQIELEQPVEAWKAGAYWVVF